MKQATVTHAIRRCKGCIFWQLYGGDVRNSAMRRMMNIQVPRRHGHACMLRTIDKTMEDGSVEAVPTLGEGKPGPRYGKRIGPSGTCKHQTPKNPPYVKPADKVEELKVHVPAAFPETELFDTGTDRERVVLIPEVSSQPTA